MRNVVLMMTSSMDGFVVGPEEHAGGVPEPDQLVRWKLDRVRRAGTHIMGRVTYEEMASFWPTSTDDYTAPMNEVPKVVFSKTLNEATWPESTIARGDLADEIAALKRQPGGEIIAWGGASSFRHYRGRVSSTNIPSWCSPSRTEAESRYSGTSMMLCTSGSWLRQPFRRGPCSMSTSRSVGSSSRASSDNHSRVCQLRAQAPASVG